MFKTKEIHLNAPTLPVAASSVAPVTLLPSSHPCAAASHRTGVAHGRQGCHFPAGVTDGASTPSAGSGRASSSPFRGAGASCQCPVGTWEWTRCPDWAFGWAPSPSSELDYHTRTGHSHLRSHPQILCPQKLPADRNLSFPAVRFGAVWGILLCSKHAPVPTGWWDRRAAVQGQGWYPNPPAHG